MTIEIKELKEGYAEFEKKYKLPSFIDLNRDFELDKIDKKSDFMLRVIRKNVMEKVINSIGFLEMLLNPMNAPRVYYFYIKSMTVQEKQLIEDIYTKLAELSLSSLELEVDYSEKEEAEIYEGVQGIAIALNSLIEDAKRGEEFLFFSSDLQEKDQEIQRFHKRYDAKRKEKKLIVKGIAPKRLERIFNEREIKNVKYVDFPIPENTGICGNKLVIFSWGEKPKAILITSKTIVEKQRKFFNQIWEMIR